MDFKSILSQLDQLNEEEGTTVHKGTYGTSHGKEDVRDQYGHKIGKQDKGAEVKKDAPKKGRGRPKKGADDSGEVKSYDFSAFGVTKGKDVKLPKHDKKKTVKHSLKEYLDQLDKALNEEYTTAPMPGAVAVKDASGKVVATAKSPQAAEMFKKGDVTLGNPEEMHEEDIGKHNNATTGFDALVKKLTPKYGVKAAKRIAGSQLKKIKEADQPPRDALASPLTLEAKNPKPDKNKNKIPDYAEDGKGKNDLKKVKEDMDSESKTDKLPSMAHIKKMCQDGKSVAEICKMHPDCDQKELKQMVADCKKKMVKEGMDQKLNAARSEGKAHGLRGHSHCGKNYEDMEEAQRSTDDFGMEIRR